MVVAVAVVVMGVTGVVGVVVVEAGMDVKMGVAADDAALAWWRRVC